MTETQTAEGLLAAFHARLSAVEARAAALACALGDRRGWPLYLVGGAVRDLLRGAPHLDLDLALDGDTESLASALAAELAAEFVLHPSFGTATISGDGWSIDLARTRTERYTAPASLPEVAPAHIEQDLGRRDFTVHALALTLNGPDPGRLLDPFGGQADLERRLLRVLYGESFRDDPTRILRLARYAVRLGFAIAEETAALARRDAVYIDALSPARIQHELERLFNEPEPERCLLCLESLKALRQVYPQLRTAATLGTSFKRLRRDGGPPPGEAEYLAAIAAGWDRVSLQRLVDRLGLERGVAAALRDVPAAARTVQELHHTGDAAAVAQLCEAVRMPALRGVAAAAGGEAYRQVRWYLSELSRVRPLLRGNELVDLGVAPGPAVGAALGALRAARLRRQVESREEEQAFVARWLMQRGSGNEGPA